VNIPFLQSAVASVSSDGSVRCGFSSTMGPSKQGDRRRRGIEKWSLEIFRMNTVDEVEKRGVDEEKSSGESSAESSGREEWRGSIATIDVSDRRSLEVETGMSEIAIHPVALHAIDSIPMPYTYSTSSSTDTDEGKDTGTVRLMAYGGASGLLRIHTINILKEIVGIES
jgi:hypothetical protein